MTAIKKKWYKSNLIIIIGVFALFFIAVCRYAHGDLFVTDELDIMIGGKGIASGYRLYNDYTSQHMPVSYYISALFELIGFKTVFSLRMCFYVLYATFWTIIFVRFRSKLGNAALVMYPLVFICLTLTYDMGHAVMSEHLAGIGIVLLYLEFVEYYDNCELNLIDCVLTSIGVVLSFGTLFISIFGVFIIALGVLFREIQNSISKRRSSVELTRHLCINALKAVIACAIPWGCLFCYYISIGSLKMFYRSAYILNRQYYPKYNGGIGETVQGTLLGGFENVWNLIGGSLTLSQFTYKNLIYLLIFALIIFYMIREWRNRGWLFVIVSLFLIVFLSVRGVFNYHGTQVVSVLALMSSIELGTCYEMAEKHHMQLSGRIMLCAVVFSLFAVSLPFFGGITSYTKKEKNKTSESVEIVKSVTDSKEGISVLVLDNYTAMLADRPIIMNAAATPWTWKCLKKTEYQNWLDSPPRVLMYDPAFYVWDVDNPISRYASKLIEYFENNYTNYSGNIYFRNDYYKEAAARADSALALLHEDNK